MEIPKKSYIPQIPVPDDVLRGSRDGLTSQLDKRSWLEVLDPKHRYAKNLRSYFKAWELMGKPGNNFLPWLDSKSFELESCPLSVLDTDRVHYCTEEEERDEFAMDFDSGLIRQRRNNEYADTGPQGWIFVLRDGVLYANEKKTVAPRFHHSSFFAGECVEVAGLIVIDAGRVRRVYPHSGHYRPNDAHLQYFLEFLRASHIDLSAIEVDAQLTMKVARMLTRDKNRYSKKQASPYLMNGEVLYNFLLKKAGSSHLLDEIGSAARHRTRERAITID